MNIYERIALWALERIDTSPDAMNKQTWAQVIAIRIYLYNKRRSK